MECLVKQQHQDAYAAKFQSAIDILSSSESDTIDALMEQITHVGSVVKVRWTAEGVGDSGWTPGWYKATVQKFDQDSDTITLKYPREPVLYEELTPLLSQGKIKLFQAVM